MWLCITVILALTIISDGKYTRIKSKPRNVFFKYREGVAGEKTLPKCRPHDACNILYKRFWTDDIVERLCKCPSGDECPWTDEFDNHTMSINNRSFLKFCEPLNHKNICKPRKTAAVVRGEVNENHQNLTAHRVRVNCYCPNTHFWHVQKYDYNDNIVYQHFRCSKQRMCWSYEFCGLVRNDLYSTYYRCSCPTGNLCINRDKELETVQEFLYSGDAINAYCHPWNRSSRHY
ncbi:kappa-scoloptoxin(11)-Ssd1b-like [Diachasmimorpha longicaudata]|uniref:kappa-scoloptoxin(11)-Ssd1b-like n=1 Tax=Diachasmimorpha longicaudata TaxID=58733 RepID=UPI0030B8F16D